VRGVQPFPFPTECVQERARPFSAPILKSLLSQVPENRDEIGREPIALEVGCVSLESAEGFALRFRKRVLDNEVFSARVHQAFMA
jgi:hypothetical protein